MQRRDRRTTYRHHAETLLNRPFTSGVRGQRSLRDGPASFSTRIPPTVECVFDQATDRIDTWPAPRSCFRAASQVSGPDPRTSSPVARPLDRALPAGRVQRLAVGPDADRRARSRHPRAAGGRPPPPCRSTHPTQRRRATRSSPSRSRAPRRQPTTPSSSQRPHPLPGDRVDLLNTRVEASPRSDAVPTSSSVGRERSQCCIGAEAAVSEAAALPGLGGETGNEPQRDWRSCERVFLQVGRGVRCRTRDR